MIDFLDELGNFKQKKIYTSKCNFFTFNNNRLLIDLVKPIHLT